MRTKLSLLLGALVLLATASLGSIAFTSSRSIIEGNAVREVGIAANARRQGLLTVLNEQKARAQALLRTASLQCAPEENWCLRRVLAGFVLTGGATTARLVYPRKNAIAVGPGASELAAIAMTGPEQLARFDMDQAGQPYYIMIARSITRDGESLLEIKGDMSVVDRIFEGNDALGRSGATFLMATNGQVLSPAAANQAPANSPVSRKPNSCGSDSEGEALDTDYRGVPVIRAVRRVAGIGGACAVAQIDQAEAFAPTNSLRRGVVGVSIVLALLAIVCSSIFAQLVSRPMDQLSARARLLQAGDYESPFPIAGPSEVQTFARTFEAMAGSLKRSHMALQNSADHIRNILESMGEAFFAFDHEWTCTYVNEKGVTLTGTPREQLLGKTLWELVPRGVGGRLRALLHRVATRKVPAQFEQHYLPLDAWFEVSAYPTHDGLAVFARDVTERKRFQERILRTQKLESLGLLAGGVAHDFNNLLTGIIGNASMLLEDLPEGNPMKASLEQVVSASLRAGALTQQLLAYAGKARLVVEPLNLSDVVGEISNLIKTSIPGNVELRLHLAKDLPAIKGDASQIQQLAMNLVINAGESIGVERSGVVVVTTATQTLKDQDGGQAFAANRLPAGEYVMLDVSDTGCGMSEQTIARIFDPFFTTKFTGRGLGLAAAMGIIRGHKGDLQVHSVPGKGSSFRILFPAHDGRAAPKARIDAAQPVGSGTVLVIDDEEVVRRAAQAALEHYGYSVIAVENGKDGLDALSSAGNAVSLVLLDLTMPVMSGEQTLQHLRKVSADLPVILSSGYDETGVSQMLSEHSLTGFIHKPYSASQLAEQVKRLLEAGRARKSV